jgi:hypothetical protein
MVLLFSAYVAVIGIVYALFVGYMTLRDEVQLASEHGLEAAPVPSRSAAAEQVAAPAA